MTTRWLDIAWAEVGTAEVPGAEANPRILQYFAEVGHPEVTSDEVAWCAAATGYCLSKAGVSLDAVPHAERLRARAYLALGTPVDVPRIGAIVVSAREVRGDPGAAHVGLVAGITPTHVYVLSGNQANRFSVAAMPRSTVIGYRWPETVTPGALDASGSRISIASRQVRDDGIKTAASNASVPFLPALPPGMSDAAQRASEAMGLFETLSAFAVFVWAKAPVLVGVLSAWWIGRMIWNSAAIRRWRAEDASTGAHVGRGAVQGESDAGDR